VSLVGKCTECGEEALGQLCSSCSGGRRRNPATFMRDSEYRERLRNAAAAAHRLHKTVMDETVGPGEAAFACLFLVQGIIETNPELPPLEWYVARLLELPKPRMT
jgi:hypothetical protein